jgi:hypothetical protein
VQSLFVSASGLVGTVYGVQVSLVFRPNAGGLADAWRFDAQGCEAGHYRVILTSQDPACPALSPPGGQTLTTYRYLANFYEVPYGGFGTGQLQFAEAASQPAQLGGNTHQIVEIDFDHANATLGPGSTAQTCGCFDRPMCISVGSASYLDAPGSELPFQLGQGFLRWNDPTGVLTGCGTIVDCFPTNGCVPESVCVAPVPALARSWGFVKNVYRAPAR